MLHALPPFKYLDLYLIWITLLLFNFNIYGIYAINYISILAIIYLIFSIKSYNLKSIISSVLILFISFLGFLRSGGYAEPFKYIFCFFQIYIFYNYFFKRIVSRKIAAIEIAKILNFFIISFVVYAFFTFYEFSSGKFLWFESRNYDSFLPRVNLGFGDSNSLASFLLIGMLLLPTRLGWSNFIIIAAGLLTFSRAYILSYAISFFLTIKNHYTKSLNILAPIFIIFIIYFLPLDHLFRKFDLNFDIDFAIKRLLASGEAENPRLTEWLISIYAIGLLPDWSVFLYSLDPHNSLLLSLNLFGLIGTLILVFSLFKSVQRIKKLVCGLPQSVNFDLAISSFIILNLFNSELFSVRSTAALGIILGLLAGISSGQAVISPRKLPPDSKQIKL